MMRPRALAAAALVTLLLPIAGVAQPAGITRSRLANGFTVIVRENPAAPVVGYSLLVKMGTRTETPETAGISHMLQLMLVRGTDKMSGEEIVAAADRMGGTIDAYGDEDYSEITATALSRNWQPMLELVGAVALRPTVTDGTLTGVRDFLVRQIRNRANKPFDVAVDRMRAALFGDHPYAWDPVGRRDSVERLTRDTLLAYYRRQYVPGQAVLAVRGGARNRAGQRPEGRGGAQGTARPHPERDGFGRRSRGGPLLRRRQPGDGPPDQRASGVVPRRGRAGWRRLRLLRSVRRQRQEG